MDFKAGDVAVSLRGHDRGRAYFVLSGTEEGLLLADGKRSRPKRKNPKHLRAVPVPAHPVAEKIRAGETATGRELRGALAALREQIGGHDAWQKMI